MSADSPRQGVRCRRAHRRPPLLHRCIIIFHLSFLFSPPLYFFCRLRSSLSSSSRPVLASLCFLLRAARRRRPRCASPSPPSCSTQRIILRRAWLCCGGACLLLPPSGGVPPEEASGPTADTLQRQQLAWQSWLHSESLPAAPGAWPALTAAPAGATAPPMGGVRSPPPKIGHHVPLLFFPNPAPTPAYDARSPAGGRGRLEQSPDRDVERPLVEPHKPETRK